MEEIGLVLEGGGQRTLFTVGVLDYLNERNLDIPYVIGVSAGASNSMSYITKQIGRNKRVNIEFVHDRRYLSFWNLLFKGSIFGMDFIFNIIPNKLVPFDYNKYFRSKTENVIGVTNCITGETEYYYKSKIKPEELIDIIIASCSLPILGKLKYFNKDQKVPYLDGGVSDPIPIRKAITDGRRKNIVILTQNKEYRKEPIRHFKLLKLIFPKYKKYPALLSIIKNRHIIYNEILDYIEELEKRNQVFIIRPQKPVIVSRTSRDKDLLQDFYQEGYNYMQLNFDNLINWIKNS